MPTLLVFDRMSGSPLDLLVLIAGGVFGFFALLSDDLVPIDCCECCSSLFD